MSQFHAPTNDNIGPTRDGVSPLATAPSQALQFHVVMGAERVTVYWPLAAHATAAEVLTACGVRAVASTSETLPPGPATRPVFGHARVASMSVSFAAYARLVQAGHAAPMHRA